MNAYFDENANLVIEPKSNSGSAVSPKVVDGNANCNAVSVTKSESE